MRRLLGAARELLALACQADRAAVWKIAVVSVVLPGGVAGVGLSQRWLVDSAGMRSTSGIAAAVIVGVLSHTTAVVLNRYRANLSHLLNDQVVLVLSHNLLRRTGRIASIEHLENPEYLNRLSLTLNGAHGLAAFCWTVAETATSVLSLALSLWLLGTVHPVLALLALCAVPPLWFGNRAEQIVNRVKDLTAEQHRLEISLHELCLEPEPAMELRIAGSDEDLSRRAGRLWDELTEREAAARVRGTVLQMLGWVCFAAGLAAALTVTAHLVKQGRATAGDVVMIVTLGTQLRQQIAATLNGMRRMGAARHIIDHYLWLRDYADHRPRGSRLPPERLRSGLRVEQLTFRHHGAERPALRDVDLFFPAGSVIGLVGPNGAGKSTLVKLITGLYQPAHGEIHIDEERLSELAPDSWAARCSGTFQDFAKLELVARHTVGVGDLPHLDDLAAVARASEHAGAADLLEALPDGPDTQLGELFDGVELSHGQWQKMALARGSMREQPLLLVFDEPTSALDPHAEHDVFGRFAAQARRTAARTGAITLLVSHRFSTVHMADRIVVLDAGRVVEEGSHSQLLDAGGLYAGLYRAQAEGYRVEEEGSNGRPPRSGGTGPDTGDLPSPQTGRDASDDATDKRGP
ncbi:hypothetical protein BJF79_09600 [Actinomadura sp. CNU-125]|uniref:ATP-binding cassette domain-containing protein n=1 Tax=Actinomadura sp. CNU-125 TaxID=1904961 RepID=UPI00095B3F77|nr:ABC transporter ATP-binding protein [Actinomadura sp. CNU-125]OLT30491.1 hypothetical protein BJF79_09600 [Actinomadura sp. CNU-125]